MASPPSLQVVVSRLHSVLPLLPRALAVDLTPRLCEQLACSPNWKVRQAAAAAIPQIAAALLTAAGGMPENNNRSHVAAGGDHTGPGNCRGEAADDDRREDEDAPRTVDRLAHLLLHQLALDGSQWVCTAAQCAAGPLICCLGSGWPLRGGLGATAGGVIGGADESAACPGDVGAPPGADESIACPGGVGALPEDHQRMLLLGLLGLYREAVLSPRPPPAATQAALAQCFAGVTARLVPAVVSWEESGLEEVFRWVHWALGIPGRAWRRCSGGSLIGPPLLGRRCVRDKAHALSSRRVFPYIYLSQTSC